MLPLRIFLLIKNSYGDWSVSVHRDLESTIETWTMAYRAGEATGVIHVGFTRSDTSLFEGLCGRFSGKILLTAPARYAFARIGPCAPRIVDVIEEIPIYVALSGWGYETTADELGLALEQLTEPLCQKCAHSIPEHEPESEWLKKFSEIFPQEAAMLKVAEIINDKSYLEHESNLEENLRIKTGRYRFHYLSADIDVDSPKEVIRIAPPWILSAPIKDIELSVRSHNVLSREGIIFVRDMAEYTNTQLMGMEHLGRKSVFDIAMSIRTAIGELPNGMDFARSQHKKGTNASEQYQTKPLDRRGQQPQLTESTTFEEALLALLNSLTRNSSMVVGRRMGFRLQQETLEEIGALLGVTREGVRQIEAKVCKKEGKKPFWRKRVEEPIKLALSERDTPLPVVGLDIIDPWFTNIKELQKPLKYVLEKFCSGKLGVIQINGVSYVSAIDQEEWDAAIKKAVRVLENGVSLKWTLSEAKHAVGSILQHKAHELREELFYTASNKAVFSTLDGSVEPILTGFGRGADAYVEAVLVESDRPLHFTEIVDRIVAKGRAIDSRRAHNSAADIGLLYGRGTYGLMQHYPLDEEETQEIIAEVEDIIESGAKGRQWHCFELFKTLCERGLDMDGRLTQYVINIALKRSKTLRYLRRLVWTAGTTATLTAGDRIEIRQAVESLLRSAGKPLSGSDIWERLLKEGRGVGRSMQIHGEGNIIKLGKNYWGLVDRDVPFSAKQQETIAEILEETLSKTQKGIHKTEICEALKDMPGIEEFATADPVLYISIALRTGRMRYAYGSYLCKSDWRDARRPTTEEAIQLALEHAGPDGLQAQELRERASEIIGVQVSISSIYTPLSAIGARPNPDTGRWQIMAGEDQLEIPFIVDPSIS